MSQRLFFKIYQNGKVLQVKQTEADQISIGCDSNVDVSLSGDGILPWHALVERKEDGYVISDLGSQSGITVNKKAVVEGVLNHGESNSN